MNPEAEAELKRILQNDLSNLTPTDVAFLKARWGYVSRDDRKRLEEAIKKVERSEKNQTPQEVTSDENQFEHPANQPTDTETKDTSEDLDLDEDSSDEDEADG